MTLTRDSVHLIIVLILTVLVVACSPAAISTAEATELPTEATAPIDEIIFAQAGPVGEAIPGMSEGQRLLAWVAPGNRPGNQGATSVGELVFFNPDGTSEAVLTLPEGTTRVTECGPGGTSPDGTSFAFIVTVFAGGSERGTIYLMNGASSELITIASEVNPASCTSSAPFQFSDDGTRFAYIDWPIDATTDVSPFGFLRIHEAATGEEIASFENVTTFDLNSAGAVWVNFFPNDDGEATEVAINTWDGTTDAEVSSLVAEEENDCYYTSASLTEVSSGMIGIMGYRCNRGDVTGTQWQLYSIDSVNRTAQLEQSDTAAGRYFVFSNTNAIFPSPDGSHVFFTLPDGISSQSVSLYTTTVDAIAPTQLIQRSALMPSVSDLPYDDNNATALISPDGRFLAIVVNTPNNDATLNVFDLSDPSLPPILLDAGDQGDTIGSMVFNNASDRLYYVAGSDDGGNNSLFALDLTTGTESRIRRGRYAQMVISPDDSTLAIMNWVEFDPEEPRYLTLEVIEIASTTPTVVYVGGETDDEGELINQSFAYPIAWRQG